MEAERICIICEKIITIRIHNRRIWTSTANRQYESRRASDEGVCWYYGRSGRWFCNECWDKMGIKDIKWDKNGVKKK